VGFDAIVVGLATVEGLVVAPFVVATRVDTAFFAAFLAAVVVVLVAAVAPGTTAPRTSATSGTATSRREARDRWEFGKFMNQVRHT
jgi:hypothetical protein